MLKRVAMVVVVLAVMSGTGFAQSTRITTIVGPPMPETGLPALTQAIDYPSGIVADARGGFYVASTTQNRVYYVAANGALTLIAGTTYGFGGDGGRATAARLAGPSGLALDAAGNLYISDTRNQRIRKVTASGVITTFAGIGTAGFSGDGGAAAAAKLSGPSGLATDRAGNVYVADATNNRIRKITPAGIISTVAGGGDMVVAGEPATQTTINTPNGVALDSRGNLYYSDAFMVRRVSVDGNVSTVVNSRFSGRGNSLCTFSGDEGPVSSASICGPRGVSVDGSDNLYIVDRGSQRIRKVTTDGIIHTVAGNGSIRYSGDGGLAISAALSNPSAVATNANGNLYIADTTNNRIRRVGVDGVIRTSAGNGTAGE